LAVNLAVTLAHGGRRTVLVDADFNGPNVASYCRLDEGPSVADILAGRRTVHEVLVRGPGGIQVVPGQWALGGLVDCSSLAQERLLTQLRSLGPHADVVVLDVGSGANRVVRRFCQAVDLALVVATPDPVSVMDAYASVKLAVGSAASVFVRPTVAAHVNLAPNEVVAAEVFQRLTRSCQRFLALSLVDAGFLLTDAAVAAAGAAGRPLLFDPALTRQAARLENLAEELVSGAALHHRAAA
jgi:flagellar biosynthesis protein FlhG